MNAHAPRPLPEPRPLPGFKQLALFLDLDGTLAAIKPRPEDVGPEAWRTGLLQELQERLEGRLAVISGRSLEEVDRILQGSVTAVAAVHGLVRRHADGTVEQAAPASGLEVARDKLNALARQHPGLLIEDKTLSLALHFRQAPELATRMRLEAEAIAKDTALKLQLGDMVAELCTPGLDKGVAVAAFMREQPFIRTAPVFVGDDLTDEDGFRAVRRFGGVSVLVGPVRSTSADMRLEDVASVRGWLEASLLQDAQP